MTSVRQNERSWVISLISDINQMLSRRTMLIRRAGGEATVRSGGRSMFPDMMLYGDTQQTNILQGWEVKMPDVSIADPDFISNAQQKAVTLGLNSFVLWNFSSCVLYTAGDDGQFHPTRTWNETAHIRTREDVELYRDDWLSLIDTILLEINDFLVNGTIRSRALLDVVSDSLMTAIIERNKGLVADALRNLAVSNETTRRFLRTWWRDVEPEYMRDEPDMFAGYAKSILLDWVNKFMFAHMIKRYHVAAYEVERIDYDWQPRSVVCLFQRITAECDFFNVFREAHYSDCITRETWEDLIEFNEFLKEHIIRNIDQGVLRNMLERSVRSSRRALVGQYTTPSTLAQLLVGLTLDDIRGSVLDPCCGTGTIARAVLDLKTQHTSIQHAYQSTWASDKFSFPLQIANLSLTNPDAINTAVRMFQANVFELEIGQQHQITDPQTGEVVSITLPELDTIVSNLPFVNFNREREEDEYIASIIDKVANETGVPISSRNDLYVYIMIHLWSMLRTGGRLGVITSNSWFGTDSGQVFYRALRHYYDIEAMYISGTGKWFDNADVIAAITILSRKEISEPSSNSQTRFGIIDRTLDELVTEQQLERLIDSAHLGTSLDGLLRIRQYSQSLIDRLLELKISLNALFHDVEWLLDIEPYLTRVNTLFDVYRGHKTGKDDFFYLRESDEVEEQYIIRGLRSSRSCTRLMSVPDSYVFVCDRTVEELHDLGHTKALSRINRHSNNLTKTLLSKGENWYMDDAFRKRAHMFTGMNPGERLFFGRFDDPTFVNQRLIGLAPLNEGVDVDLCHALLNSIIGMFYIEAMGFPRGLGALDINKGHVERMLMLNPARLTRQQREAILDAFRPLLSRDILTTPEELERTDRINFDRVVLDAYGIADYYERIQESVLSMQNVRIRRR